MKYVKGTQQYNIGEGSELPTWKCRLVCNGEGEGIWITQGHNEVVLLNDSIHFLPFRTWGAVLQSKSNPEDTSKERETIDVTEFRGETPDGVVITLHPEAWDQYIEHGYINENGEIISDEFEDEPDPKELN